MIDARLLRRASLCAALGALASASRVAAAESVDVSPEHRALAETLFFTGRGLMEAKRYAEACEKFSESYRLDPAAGTLLNLAVCHEEDGKIASAWGEYRQALLDARRMGRQDRIELVEERLAAIEPALPKLTIVVPLGVVVPGMVVKRNSVPLGEAAWNLELPVDPGDVAVTIEAPGYETERLRVRVERREQRSITLAPLEKAVEPPPPVRRTRVWSTEKRWGLATTIAGSAVAIAGVSFGVAAAAARQDSDGACPYFDGARRCSQAGVDAMSRAGRFAWASDVALGLGVVGIGIGGYYLFTGHTYERPVSAVEWSVAPMFGGVQGRLELRF